MDERKARHKFNQHKSNAKRRGIGFNLTFAEWLAVWGDDLDRRGRHRDEVGMCRIMDSGPYAVGNVFIGTPKRNAHTRRIVYADRIIKGLQQEREPEPPPDVDLEAENPWLPSELLGHRSWTWERNRY